MKFLYSFVFACHLWILSVHLANCPILLFTWAPTPYSNLMRWHPWTCQLMHLAKCPIYVYLSTNAKPVLETSRAPTENGTISWNFLFPGVHYHEKDTIKSLIVTLNTLHWMGGVNLFCGRNIFVKLFCFYETLVTSFGVRN